MATDIPLLSLRTKAAKYGVPPELLERVVVGTMADPKDPRGLVHSARSSWCDQGFGSSRRPVPGAALTLLQLESVDLCYRCRHSHAAPTGQPDHLGDLRFLLQSRDLVASAGRMVKAGGSKSAGRTSKLVSELVQTLRQTERLLDNPKGFSDPQFETLTQELRDLLTKAHADLTSIAQSPDVRAKMEEMIRSELVPSAYRAVMTLDDSLVLGGFLHARSPSRKVSEVIDAYKVGGTSPHPVIHAPRFVADWLLRTYATGSSWGSSHLFTVPAPVTSEVAQTAAALWDPAAKSAMSDISAALAAASILMPSE